MERTGAEPSVQLLFDDADDAAVFYDELRGVPGVFVEAISAPNEPGEQGGVVEMLSAAVAGGAIPAALNLVQALVESRRDGFVLKARDGKRKVEITADNAQEALEVVREMLDGES
jgi:hypothetical protein